MIPTPPWTPVSSPACGRADRLSRARADSASRRLPNDTSRLRYPLVGDPAGAASPAHRHGSLGPPPPPHVTFIHRVRDIFIIHILRHHVFKCKWATGSCFRRALPRRPNALPFCHSRASGAQQASSYGNSRGVMLPGCDGGQRKCQAFFVPSLSNF